MSESFEIRSILPYCYFLSFYNYVVIYRTKRNINLVTVWSMQLFQTVIPLPVQLQKNVE